LFQTLTSQAKLLPTDWLAAWLLVAAAAGHPGSSTAYSS
jgi:hypothetical protein